MSGKQTPATSDIGHKIDSMERSLREIAESTRPKKPEKIPLITQLVAIGLVLSPMLICCSFPIWMQVSGRPKLVYYYNFKPSIDVAWKKENERIPEVLRNALNQTARELVEKKWPVTETQIRSSKPFSQNTNYEEFGVLVILDDGNEWLKREGFWVSLIVDITLDTPDQQAASLQITDVRNAGFGH